MKYKSYHPTKEKKNLYDFFEKNKSYGTVSAKKVNKYIKRKNLLSYVGRGKESNRFEITNRRGTLLATGGLNKKNRISMWAIR